VFDNRESQTRAAVLLRDRVIRLAEGLEDVLSRLFGNARSRILDLHGPLLFAALIEADAHFAFFGELDGVAGQIGHHLVDAFGVADQLGR
jgi:hypothetical protein